MSTTSTPPPNPTLPLKDLLAIVVSMLSLAKMIFDLFSNSPFYIFLIALIIFMISGAYYLFGLYKNNNYKTLWKLFAAFYVLSIGFALGGSWYYYTQYDPNGFAIEKTKFSVYPYEGSENGPQDGSVYLGTGSSYESNRFVTFYDLEYSIPDVVNAWGGFSIEFFQPIDLTTYKYIQLKIKYGDPNALVRLVLKDDAQNSDSVLLDSKYIMNEKTSLQTITVPLDLFQQITLGNIREFVIDANSYFITGDHEVWISEIHFVK